MVKTAINFKGPLWMTARLDAALDMERGKYESCPAKPDLVPGHEVRSSWDRARAVRFSASVCGWRWLRQGRNRKEWVGCVFFRGSE